MTCSSRLPGPAVSCSRLPWSSPRPLPPALIAEAGVGGSTTSGSAACSGRAMSTGSVSSSTTTSTLRELRDTESGEAAPSASGISCTPCAPTTLIPGSAPSSCCMRSRRSFWLPSTPGRAMICFPPRGSQVFGATSPGPAGPNRLTTALPPRHRSGSGRRTELHQDRHRPFADRRSGARRDPEPLPYVRCLVAGSAVLTLKTG